MSSTANGPDPAVARAASRLLLQVAPDIRVEGIEKIPEAPRSRRRVLRRTPFWTPVGRNRVIQTRTGFGLFTETSATAWRGR